MSAISSMMMSTYKPTQAGGGDPYQAQTVTLLHFEGANASTTITNSISSGIAYTKGSNSYTFITTERFKFGSTSFVCQSPSNAGPGATSGIYPTTKTLSNGSWIPRDYWWANDTTAESFVYVRSNTAGGQFAIWHGLGAARFNAGFWNTNSGAGMSFEVEFSSSGTYTAGTGGTGYYNLKWTIGNSILDGWHHVALVRSGNSLLLFIDGVDKGTASLTSGSGRTSADIFLAGNPYVGTGGTVTGNLAIADMGGAYTDYGFRRSYMDEFRFTNAVARYTTTFSVPTEAYPDA